LLFSPTGTRRVTQAATTSGYEEGSDRAETDERIGSLARAGIDPEQRVHATPADDSVEQQPGTRERRAERDGPPAGEKRNRGNDDQPSAECGPGHPIETADVPFGAHNSMKDDSRIKLRADRPTLPFGAWTVERSSEKSGLLQ
jgi:hypothetical protein